MRAAGAARQAQGRFEAAIAFFRQAVELSPRDPQGYVALAGCLFTARQPETALQVCDVGDRHAGASAELLCARAAVLQSLSRVDEAAAAYRHALAADPASGEARHGLALQAAEAGDWNEAEALVAPLPPSPALDWLAARIALGRSDFETARSRAAAAEQGMARPDQRAEAALLVGEALDGLVRHADAFAAFGRGKGALRVFYAERAAAREGETAKLERLAAWFSAADRAPWRRAPPADDSAGAKGHAFLLGFPRSGTTLLEQALAGHPDLVALEEAPTLAEAYDAFLADAAGLDRLARLSAPEAARWRAIYWRTVAAHGVDPRGRVFLDKAPAGTPYLPLIAKLFPTAKLLFAVRDPRDVVLSCFRSSFQMNALTYAFTDLVETARCYAASMRLAEIYRRVLPIDLIEVRYERLVDDFAGQLASVAEHLGLAMAPGMTDIVATARRRNIRTPSAAQVRAGLNRQGIGRWRAYADEMAQTLPILDRWVRKLGYGGEGSAASVGPSAALSSPSHGS